MVSKMGSAVGANAAPRGMRWYAAWFAVRAFAVAALLTSAYVLAPLGARVDESVSLQFAIFVVVLVLVIAWEMGRLARSPYPGLRAVETAFIAVLYVLFAFAATYYTLDHEVHGSFTSSLTRL